MVTVRQNGEVIGEVDTSDYRTGQVGDWTLDEKAQLPDKWRLVRADHDNGATEWYVVRDADPVKALMSGGASGSVQEGADQIGDVSDLTSSRHGFSSGSEARTAYEAFSGRDLGGDSDSSTSSSSGSSSASTASSPDTVETSESDQDDDAVVDVQDPSDGEDVGLSAERHQEMFNSGGDTQTQSTDPMVDASAPSTTSSDSGGSSSSDGVLSNLSTKQKAAIGVVLGGSALVLGGGA